MRNGEDEGDRGENGEMRRDEVVECGVRDCVLC